MHPWKCFDLGGVIGEFRSKRPVDFAEMHHELFHEEACMHILLIIVFTAACALETHSLGLSFFEVDPVTHKLSRCTCSQHKIAT